MSVFDPYDGVTYGVQLAIAAILFVSARSKLTALGDFTATVASYQLLPSRIPRVIAVSIVTAESLLCMALATGFGGIAVVAASFVLFATFAGAVAVNLGRGMSIACGCFGRRDERISRATLTRLVLLLGTAAALAGLDRAGHQLVTVSQVAGAGPGPALRFVVSAGGFSLFLLLAGTWAVSFPQLLTVMSISDERSRGSTR